MKPVTDGDCRVLHADDKLQVAADVVEFDQVRELAVGRRADLAGILAELRRDPQ